MKLNKILAGLVLTTLTTAANAQIMSFIHLTENATTGLGESAWNTLSINLDGVDIDISATKGGNDAYAYLDWGNAGLGVCGALTDANGKVVDTAYQSNGKNLCAPSSDDNVTVAETLSFYFHQDAIINNFWFNNNHDDGFSAGDKITIDGTEYDAIEGYAYAPLNDGIGSFSVAAGSTIEVSYFNEEFYIGGMEVSAVTEPATLALLGLGLAGLGVARRKKA